MSQSALPLEPFSALSDADCNTHIIEAKAKLGKRLVILAHHYQRDEVFQHADFTGDSLKLSRQAASSGAEFIIFCGVHFMAEVADMLTDSTAKVILPDLSAGCSMADMADLKKVNRAWQELSEIVDADKEILPVTYINSPANLKAFCGRHGGVVCTSSNARHILEWALKQRKRVLFFPDQHLGRNTGYGMGIPLEKMPVWNFDHALGGLDEKTIKDSTLLLWDGYCSVHQMFLPQHIDNFKLKYPDAKIISHPECSFNVCQKSDEVGSTEFIIKTITASPSGARWLVGTEINLVNRLAKVSEKEGKFVHFMSPMTCVCTTMYRTDPQHLLWALENLLEGHLVNQISVPTDVTEESRLALQRMFDLSPPSK